MPTQFTTNNSYTATVTGTSTGTGDGVWNGWMTATSSSITSSSTSYVWSHWMANSLQVVERMVVEITAEQSGARRRAAEAYQAQVEAQRVEWALADQVAEALLREFLSPEQNEQLTTKGEFELEVYSQGKETPRVYTIARGSAGNIHRTDVEKGKRIRRRFCIHPIEQVPHADAMLAQMLLLQANEAEFLRIANMSVLDMRDAA